MESNSVCNTSSQINKIGQPQSGSLICLITSMATDRIGWHQLLLPINHNHYNFRENKCIPFSLPNFTNLNSSVLENPQFGRVGDCCYGYCDKFCDGWIKLSALNMIGWYNCLITGVQLQPTVWFHCPITTLHNN